MWLGRTVDGRFLLQELAGKGGMGAVYRALDTESGQHVAFKVLLDTNADGHARFDREAKVLARLGHPNIARYVAHGAIDEDTPYLAMEWLDGEELALRLSRGPLSVEETISLGRRASEALAVIHAEGVVHRDLKPQNLFLLAGDVANVKLLDFGIARLSFGTQMLTQTGAMLGTAAYMAPEQIRGEVVDARADLYSLGCVLFECLVGRPPFEAAQMIAVLTKALFDEPPRVQALAPHVPAWLDQLIARLLDKAVDNRPASARELLHLLTEPPPTRISLPPPSLGARERKLVCVVLIVPTQNAGELDETIAAPASTSITPVPPTTDPSTPLLAHLGGGAFAAVVTGASSPHDLVARAAFIAIDLRARWPDAAIAVALGRDETGETQTMGDVIDRAARLLPSAAETLVDEACARLLAARFELRKCPGGYVLTGALAEQVFVQEQTIPFLGRDRELSMLLDLVGEAIDEPRAMVAIVTAAAGAGKSRLQAEVVHKLVERHPRLEIWFACADPMAAGSPFAILIAATRRAMGLSRDDSSGAYEKIRTYVERWIPDDEGMRVARFVGELLGVRGPDVDEQLASARRDPFLMGQQIRRAFEDLFAAICADHPVLLVLDDLQWGDVATVKLLDDVLRHVADAPLCILALARPEIDEVLPKAWAPRGAHRIRMAGLPRKACERLARQVLGSDAMGEVIGRIVERADGNAFFLEELLRAAQRGECDAFPETVLAMAQSRIERLDADVRRALRVASIYGDSFGIHELQSLVGLEPAQLEKMLMGLVEADVLVRRQGSVDSSIYAFRHAFLREAAYAMLTTVDRIHGHLWVAKQLEGRGDPLAIAQHFERGGAPRRAVPWWTHAVDELLTGNDLEAAVRRGEHALGLEASDEERGKLHVMVATACCWLGRFDDAERHAMAALGLLPAATTDWYVAIEQINWASNSLGRPDTSTFLHERLAALEPAAVRSTERAIAWLCPAETAFLHGRIAEGDRLLEEAMRVVEESDPSTAVDARVAVVLACRDTALNRHRHAIDSFLRARDFYIHMGDTRRAVLAMANAGTSFVFLGAYADAERHLRGSLARCRRLGLTSQTSYVEHYFGHVLVLLGRHDEGFAHMRQALRELVSVGPRLYRLAMAELGLLLLSTGDVDGAAQCVKDALGDGRSEDSPAMVVLALRTRVLIARGHLDAAVESARRAVAMQESIGNREYAVTIYLSAARAAEAVGDESWMRDMCSKALDEIRSAAQFIDDASERARFFECVPDNRVTLDLAKGFGLSIGT